MRKVTRLLLAAVLAGSVGMSGLAQAVGERAVTMLPGECWWGLANAFGEKMPFTASSGIKLDLTATGWGNQTASLLLSNRGREIWCDGPTRVEITNGVIRLSACEPTDAIELVETGGTLRDAYLHASKAHFPPSGKTPDDLFFTAPQYNTWVELTYNQNERDILAYAQSMLDNGLPPGVLMIDDTWQFGYGTWEFDPRRFSDPKGMVDRLHRMGYKVMLWICPWVSMDSVGFRELAWGVRHNSIHTSEEKGGFLRNAAGQPAACRWWNGFSALLDFTDPLGERWFAAQCDRLCRDYGIDGFKFDGGDVSNYGPSRKAHEAGLNPCEQSRRYAEFAARYPVNEYRCAWKMAGQPLVMRLYDKGHRWSEVAALMPQLISGGLLGHQFLCPDMIGGGSWHAFLPDSPLDQDIVVRSAQVHALCGMMQFSVSPWRILDSRHQEAVRKAVVTRQKFADRILALAKACARTGEPMIRHLEYQFPGNGYEAVTDEFALGDFLVVAPQTVKDATSRTVRIPPGTWTADDGATYTGPSVVTMSTPLERLPYLVRTAR